MWKNMVIDEYLILAHRQLISGIFVQGKKKKTKKTLNVTYAVSERNLSPQLEANPGINIDSINLYISEWNFLVPTQRLFSGQTNSANHLERIYQLLSIVGSICRLFLSV